MKYKVGQFVKFTNSYCPKGRGGQIGRINTVDGMYIVVSGSPHRFIPDKECGGGENWVIPVNVQMYFHFSGVIKSDGEMATEVKDVKLGKTLITFN